MEYLEWLDFYSLSLVDGRWRWTESRWDFLRIVCAFEQEIQIYPERGLDHSAIRPTAPGINLLLLAL